MKICASKLLWVFVILILISEVNCTNHDDPIPALQNPVAIGDSLVASFNMVDSDGNPRTSFREGENVSFSFIIQNQSSQPIRFLLWDFPMTNSDFFLLKKYSSQENAYQPLGRPFDTVTSSYDLTDQDIPAKTTLFYEIPWQLQLNKAYEMPTYKPRKADRLQRIYSRTKQSSTPLTKGVYRSSFDLDIAGRVVPFVISFTVE